MIRRAPSCLSYRTYSCGFDACEHEYASMSRHGRTVPVEFYHRFTRDACALADRIAGGRIISLLEGTSEPRCNQYPHSLTALDRRIQ